MRQCVLLGQKRKGLRREVEEYESFPCLGNILGELKVQVCIPLSEFFHLFRLIFSPQRSLILFLWQKDLIFLNLVLLDTHSQFLVCGWCCTPQAKLAP